MPLTEAQKRAKANYNKKITKVQIELISPQDDDIIEKLAEQPSKQAYIKNLIRNKLESENVMKAKRPQKRSADHLRFYKTANCLGQGMIIVYDTEKHKSTFIDCDDIAEGYGLIATTAIYMQDSRLFDSLDDIDDDTTPTLDTSGMKDVTKDVLREYNKLFD